MRIKISGCLIFTGLLGTGCTADWKDPDSDGEGSDAGSSDAGGSATIDALIDSEVSGDTSQCEDYSGTPIPGAASWFIGDYTVTDGSVTGTERWVLYANAEWILYDGADCEIVWSMTGEQVDPLCATCDLGLEVSGAIDLSQTTCDPQIYQGDEYFSALYDVESHGDGSTSWYFAETGGWLAGGVEDGNQLAFVTDQSCLWF